MKGVTYFVHVYYPGSWKLITDKCGWLFSQADNIVVSACHDDVITEIETSGFNVIIQKVTNKGKDIGGKLAGLSYYNQFLPQSEFLTFLHDKISPQTLNAEYWFDQLYDIFSKEKFEKALELLKKGKAGLAGSKGFMRNEWSSSKKTFNTTNDSILRELISRYQLVPSTYDYIGGTVFITRHDAFTDFFRVNDPFMVRQDLEEGNVLDLEEGTYTHSWERLLCLIPQSKGFKIAGV
ncbi:MAG: hypothetical protein ABW036_09210 [Flavitalea sp.]